MAEADSFFMTGPKVLLVVGGGIAAYKSCELVRTIRKAGGSVTCVLTESGSKFVTPMALAALSENPVHTTLWDLRNEVEMGHIQLSREADLVVVCPATANLLAKMSSGIADDLATTLLLATDKPVMAIPAMNVRMWQHASTQRNVETLRSAGVDVMEPDEGDMACGEYGPGRLPEPPAIWQRIGWALGLEGYDTPDLPAEAAQASAPVAPQPVSGVAPVEAIEPEPDASDHLGGLSGSLIARSIQKAKQAIGLGDHPHHDDVQVSEELPEPETAELEAPVEDIAEEPVLDGPIMAKKGGARAAPPTDPEAINHLVKGEEDFAPQPLEGEAPGAFPDTGEGAPVPEVASVAEAEADPDPLDGQPDFDDDPAHRPLYGKHVVITAGPTWEPIDPVRYLSNRSSGRQGYAIAEAAAAAGARVTLVSGPVCLDTPPGVERVDVESAVEMAEAVKQALPADVGIMVAAVADWRPQSVAGEKIKKRGSAPPALLLTENPDILATTSGSRERPKLLIGFAAETNDVIQHAKDKRKRKGVDWIVANDVSGDVMGGSNNLVHIIKAEDVETLDEMPKEDVARALVERIADALNPAADS
ncbi:MAG: phosphopantothenoylcysteine decarboxylase [Sphingomonadaceae bacterium]